MFWAANTALGFVGEISLRNAVVRDAADTSATELVFELVCRSPDRIYVLRASSRRAARRGQCLGTATPSKRKLYMVGPNRETWPNTLTENPY